jgi:hypothetical protein
LVETTHSLCRAMTCEPPPPLPKKPRSPPAAPTTISALGDDLLREIFLRLPSLPTLVRAALTCRASLRAVRSSPAFRRRFRDLHSPPLLGLFIDIFDHDTPVLRPLRSRSNPDVAAVVRGADFFLTRLPDDEDEGSAPQWLLPRWVPRPHQPKHRHMAVYNPLTGALIFSPTRRARSARGCTLSSTSSTLKKTPGPFRVICVCREAWGAQAAILSSETREWQIFPWVDAESMQPDDDDYSSHSGILANGFIYWTQAS